MRRVFITMLAILGFGGFAFAGVVTDNLYGYFHAADPASFSEQHNSAWFNVAGLYGGIAPHTGITGIYVLVMDNQRRPPSYWSSVQSFSFNSDDYMPSENDGVRPFIGQQGTPNTYSFEVWLNPRATNGLVLTAGALSIKLENSAFAYSIYQGLNSPSISVNTGQAISMNQWHHLVFTCDGATCKTYLDGQHINGGDTTNPTANFYLREPARLGEFGWYNGFDGLMKVFRYYDDSLTAEEVLGNFNYGMATNVPEPCSLVLLLVGGVTMLRKRTSI